MSVPVGEGETLLRHCLAPRTPSPLSHHPTVWGCLLPHGSRDALAAEGTPRAAGLWVSLKSQQQDPGHPDPADTGPPRGTAEEDEWLLLHWRQLGALAMPRDAQTQGSC